jgi:hypothetical protein
VAVAKQAERQVKTDESGRAGHQNGVTKGHGGELLDV